MKKYLLGIAFVGVMAFGTSTVVAGTPAKKAVKTEQTATVKKATAKAAATKAKCDKKCSKKCCPQKAAKKTVVSKKAPVKK